MSTCTIRCSVVIPTYNRAPLLEATLASLVRQSLSREQFEVFVVDDGSSDNSRQVAQGFSDRLNLDYQYQEDRGYRVARARNLGIRKASSPIAIFIDSGVILHSGCLEAHCQAHESSPIPTAFSGYVFGFNEDNEDAAEIRSRVDLSDADATMQRFQASGLHLDLREEFYAKYGDEFWSLPAPWLVFWTCNASAPLELIRRVGLFDEAFVTWGAEDVELAYRLHRAGCRFRVCRRAKSIHYPHEKSYHQNMQSAAGNYRYFAQKYGTPHTALVVGNHFWVINDIIRERGLPPCDEYLRKKAAERQGRMRQLTAPELPIEAGPILVFSPHPDDETIAAGATICRHRQRGEQVHIWFATDGSQSHAAVLGIHSNPSPAELIELRKAESIAAAAELGVDAANVHFFGFPDTALVRHIDDFRRAVLEKLSQLAPPALIYLPDEDRELHADHRITGKIARECAMTLGLQPRLLKYTVWDRETEAAFEYRNRLDDLPSDPREEQVVRVEVGEFMERKLAALARHRTQTALFSPVQTRPVVPLSFVERLRQRSEEEFVVHCDHPRAATAHS